jgi:hypothetical protein
MVLQLQRDAGERQLRNIPGLTFGDNELIPADTYRLVVTLDDGRLLPTCSVTVGYTGQTHKDGFKGGRLFNDAFPLFYVSIPHF